MYDVETGGLQVTNIEFVIARAYRQMEERPLKRNVRGFTAMHKLVKRCEAVEHLQDEIRHGAGVKVP
jgi:hypothetical protein